MHVATRVGELGGESDDRVLLAVALAVRATRRGSVCLDLAAAHESAPELPWPEPAAWREAVWRRRWSRPGWCAGTSTGSTSTATTGSRPRSSTTSRARTDTIETPVDEARLEATAALLRGTQVSERAAAGGDERRTAPDHDPHRRPRHRQDDHGRPDAGPAGRPGGRQGTSALDRPRGADRQGGDPARRRRSRPGSPRSPKPRPRPGPRPSGSGTRGGVTLHRLLGWRPDNSTRFRHDRSNRLKYDVVVVDESSMVELTMMGRLLEALRPQARLVLVGDPEQLTSVGAGAVLSDLVEGYGTGPDSPVAAAHRELPEHRGHQGARRGAPRRRRRRGARRAADAVRPGRVRRGHQRGRGRGGAAARLRGRCSRASSRPRSARSPRWRSPPSTSTGCSAPTARVRPAYAAGTGMSSAGSPSDPGVDLYDEWYVGRPLLVTSNDYALDVYNGETGVVVRQGQRRRAFISGSERAQGARTRPPRRGRDDARAHHPQEPGQPGQGGVGAAAGRRLAAADPRALLHRGHPRPGARARRRHRGRGPRSPSSPRPVEQPGCPSGSPVRPHPEPPETRPLPASPRVG